jgi:chromosome segregation ATPase
MQLQENTPAQWATVIADLAAKRQSTLAHLEELCQEKKSLALDAAMGNEEARKRLQKVNAEIHKLAMDVDDFEVALSNANGEKQKAQATANAKEERQRQEELRDSVRLYFEEVKKIDQALKQLAARFQSARVALQSADSQMTPEERTPIQQLYTLFGSTLAASFHGLGEYIELGRSAGVNPIHRQPLWKYVYSFVDRWIPTPNGDAKEK